MTLKELRELIKDLPDGVTVLGAVHPAKSHFATPLYDIHKTVVLKDPTLFCLVLEREKIAEDRFQERLFPNS